MSFEYVEMSELIEDIAMGPFGSDVKVDTLVDEGIPFLSGSNVTDFKLNDDNLRFIDQSKYDKFKKAMAKRGDIIITHRGTLGQIVFIPETSRHPEYIISQSQFRVRVNEKVIPQYLVYFFHSRLGQHILLSNASRVGVPALARPTTTFKQLRIPLPDLETQNACVRILDSIQNMIEVNTRINDYLAKYAKAIYKASIKTSFSPTKLSSITLAITDGTHSTIQDDPNGDYLLLSSKNIKDGLIQIKDDERRINKEVFERLRSRTNLSKGDILLTSVGTIGECALVSEANNFEFQRSVAIIRPNPECISPEYLYTALVCNQELLINAAHGAVQQCLFLRDINDLEVPLSTKISDNTTMLLKSIYRNIDHNNQINLNLIKVRDTILNDIFMRYS